MIDLHWLYVLAGAVFAGFAIGSARDETNPNRWGNAAFWLLLVASFWFGDFFGDVGNGILVSSAPIFPRGLDDDKAWRGDTIERCRTRSPSSRDCTPDRSPRSRNG